MSQNIRRFKYLLRPFCLQLINFQDSSYPLMTLRSWQLPSVYTINMERHSLKNDTLRNVLTLGMATIAPKMSRHFDIVKTGELPTSECKQ